MPPRSPRGGVIRVAPQNELKALSARCRIRPSDADVWLMGSKALKADPDHPETIAPALKDLNEVIALAPERSDFYLVRATLSCFNHAEPALELGVNPLLHLLVSSFCGIHLLLIDPVVFSNACRTNTVFKYLQQYTARKAGLPFSINSMAPGPTDFDNTLCEENGSSPSCTAFKSVPKGARDRAPEWRIKYRRTARQSAPVVAAAGATAIVPRARVVEPEIRAAHVAVVGLRRFR